MFNVPTTRYVRDTSYIADRAVKRMTKASINRKVTERMGK